MTTASADLVLIDTSIWIDYFRKAEPVFSRLEGLIEQEKVCLIHFILAELLQGTNSDTEFATLKGATEIFPFLEEKRDSWVAAARLSGHLRREGYPVGLGDCFIATMAQQHNVSLWSLDKHFKRIQRVIKINLMTY